MEKPQPGPIEWSPPRSTETTATTARIEVTAPADSAIAVDVTTELRWFFDGDLGPETLSWFTDGGNGLTEARCDTYRLDGQVDVGVKRRFRTTLELKRRLRPAEPFAIGSDLHGRLECWQRWSPADGRVELGDGTIWVDVDKWVIKRRFDRTGEERALSEETRAMTGEGCDVEIARVSADGRSAWTFAFAAFGPLDGHRDSLLAAWNGLLADGPPPGDLRLTADVSCGYPEWMSRFWSSG